MKKQLKLVILSFTFALGLSGCFGGGVESLVPEEWYVLPESGRTPAPTDPAKVARLGGIVEQVFSSHREALESAIPAASEGESRPWKLEAYVTDLAITAEGTLGTLLMDGSAAVRAVWRRRGADGREHATERLGGKSPLVIQGSPDPKRMARELETVIRAAVATGRIRDERFLRENVLAAGEDFRQLIGQVSKIRTGSTAWKLAGLRMAIGIEASGELTPEVTGGVELSFRMDWDYVPSREPIRPSLVLPRNALLAAPGIQPRMAELVRAIASDLGALTALERDENPVREAGFEAETVIVSFGVTVEGEVGVAETATSAMASLVFEKSEEEERAPASASLLAAGVRGLNVIRPAGTSGADEAVRVDRERFRSGMRKALAIGGFFARHSRAGENEQWAVEGLITEFELSVTGEVGLTTVSGSAAVEIEFARSETAVSAVSAPQWREPAAPARAAASIRNDGLAPFFASEIGKLEIALASEIGNGDRQVPVSDWYARYFFLGVAPSVSFGLDDVIQLTITPQIELVWEKAPLIEIH